MLLSAIIKASEHRVLFISLLLSASNGLKRSLNFGDSRRSYKSEASSSSRIARLHTDAEDSVLKELPSFSYTRD
jgi:hypothetical protein